MITWYDTRTTPPPDNILVMTKIANPDRNIQPMRLKGRLWWTQDDKMYVYYTPTHWCILTDYLNNLTHGSNRTGA